jgi:signal transduction histidine kinase
MMLFPVDELSQTCRRALLIERNNPRRNSGQGRSSLLSHRVKRLNITAAPANTATRELGSRRMHSVSATRLPVLSIVGAGFQPVSASQTQPDSGPPQDTFGWILEEIASELELRPLLTSIITRACGLLNAENGAIALYDERRHSVQVEAVHRLPDTEIGMEFEPGEGLMGRVLATGKSCFVDRYGDLDRISLPEYRNQAVLGVPILGRGSGLIGVFGIGARAGRKFGQSDVETLQLFARHAAIAIQNALRYARELRRSERMTLIARVSRLASTGLDAEQLVATAAQVIHDHLGYPNVVIPLIHRGDPDFFLFRAHAGSYRDVFETPFQMPTNAGICGAAVTMREAQVVNDVRDDPRYVPPPVHINVRTELAVPIILGDEVFGCINIEGLRPFDEDDVSSVRIIADHLAVAIQNARLSSEARQAAVMRERQRLARDLHDAVSQALSSISLMSQSLVSAWRRDPAEGERRTHRLEELARLAFAEMRALLRELRPSSLEYSPSELRSGIEDVRAVGLKAALHRFANMLAPQTPTIRLDFSAYRQQDPSLEEGLFLICREALSNAIRHSGAHRVEIRATIVVDELVLSVIDNGAGFDERATSDEMDVGIGLQTMRERAAALAALCQIHSQPGHGTSVVIRLPLAGLNAEAD